MIRMESQKLNKLQEEHKGELEQLENTYEREWACKVELD